MTSPSQILKTEREAASRACAPHLRAEGRGGRVLHDQAEHRQAARERVPLAQRCRVQRRQAVRCARARRAPTSERGARRRRAALPRLRAAARGTPLRGAPLPAGQRRQRRADGIMVRRKAAVCGVRVHKVLALRVQQPDQHEM